MSSSSNNSTELSFIDSDNSATENGKNDYQNSGAEHGIPETNLEYAHINDEDVNARIKAKRPLPPIPDWIIMPPPTKNSTPCVQSWKEVCSKNCGYFRLILSITLSVLAVAALGVVIYLVVPKAPCPCEAEYELISNRVLKCELKVIGCTTLSFDKVSGANIGRILYQSRICIPDNVETYRFSARWMSDGTLIKSINFSPVQCQDEGNYSLTVTSKAGTKVYYIHLLVIDHPEEPTVSIPNGLIGNKESALQCQASTGCRNASVTVQATAPNCQDYFPWETNITQIHYPVGGIWKTNVTLILPKFEVNINFLQNRLFRCTYYMDGKSYYSQPIRMQIIPADFCTDKTSKCDYPHPYDCNKYITCTIIPLERTCQSGLNFMDSNNCEGRCNYPNQAMCNIHQSDGGYCGNT